MKPTLDLDCGDPRGRLLREGLDGPRAANSSDGPKVKKAELSFPGGATMIAFPLRSRSPTDALHGRFPRRRWLRMKVHLWSAADHSFVYLQLDNGFASMRSESFGWIARSLSRRPDRTIQKRVGHHCRFWAGSDDPRSSR